MVSIIPVSINNCMPTFMSQGYLVIILIITHVVLFTARVRNTLGRYCFHRCLSVHKVGTPSPQPGQDGGRVPPGRYSPGQGRYPPSQVRMVGYHKVGTLVKVGTPGQVRMGVPQGRYPLAKVGTPWPGQEWWYPKVGTLQPR